MKWFEKDKTGCAVGEALNAEVEGTKKLIEQSIDGLATSVCRGFENGERMHKELKDSFQRYAQKMDGLIFGNGEEGLKTKVVVQETKLKTLRNEINGVGEKGRVTETRLHERIDDANKDLEEKYDKLIEKIDTVSKATLVNSTKLYCFCGGFGVLMTLASIFVPMIIGD